MTSNTVKIALAVICLYTCHPFQAQAGTGLVCRSAHPIAPVEVRRAKGARLRKELITRYGVRLARTQDEQSRAAFEIIHKVMPQRSETQGIPMISNETVSMLQMAYDPMTSKEMPEAALSEMRRHALQTFKKDPYLLWLGKNQVRGVQWVDPIRALLDPLEKSEPYSLTPILSIVNLYRSLERHDENDPSVAIADRALELRKREMVLTQIYENLKSAGGSAGPLDARGLAPDLQTAKTNLENVLNRQVQQYGGIFPLQSYKRANGLMSMNDSSLKIIFEIGHIDESERIPAEIETALMALKAKLELPEEFPIADLPRVIHMLKGSNEDPQSRSYPTFLIRAFGHPEMNIDFIRILNLKTLIELMEADKDKTIYEKMISDREEGIFPFAYLVF